MLSQADDTISRSRSQRKRAAPDLRRPPKRARRSQGLPLTPSTLKALAEREEGEAPVFVCRPQGRGTLDAPAAGDLLAIKRRARALEAERTRSTVAVAARDTAEVRIANGRRRGAINIKRMWAKPEQQLREKSPYLKRVLEAARDRGDLTDFSYGLLLEVMAEVMREVPASPSTIATSNDSPSLDAEPLDLDMATDLDESNERFDLPQMKTNEYDSELIYQAEAAARDWSYKRGRLDQVHAVGLAAGVVCHSPFDAAYAVNEEPHTVSRRELRPLRLSRDLIDPASGAFRGTAIRDLNRPGFVRAFILSLASGFAGEADERLHRAAVEALARCHSRLSPTMQSPEPTEQYAAPFSVEDRQLINIVNACWDMGLPETKARRKESSELYKRLARALDQRAPPADRLFGGNKQPSVQARRRREDYTSYHLCK